MDDSIIGVIELMEHMSEEERLQVFDLIADFYMLDGSRRCDLLMLSERLSKEYIAEGSSDMFIKELVEKHLS